MTEENIWANRKRQTFREAEGLAVPTQMQTRQISKATRARLWKAIHSDIEANLRAGVAAYELDEDWHRILGDHHIEIAEGFIDDFYTDWNSNRAKLRVLFETGDYADVYEFVQFALRHPNCPSGMADEVAAVLAETRAAYRLISDPPTIIPLTEEQALRGLEKALEDTGESGTFAAAHEHLVTAAECLTRGDNSGAIRESIHAVESAAKLIDGDAKATLGPALKRIEAKDGALHPALRKAFEILYGYTSDKDGIRHASLSTTDKSVGEDEAIFMHVACAGFVSYLISKSAKLATQK